MHSVSSAIDCSVLEPTVKYHLQQHLVNVHQGKASALKIGTTEQLGVATKISSNQKVSQCFGWDGAPCSYPKLPKRNYLVACVDRWLDIQVFAIYSLEQMNQMHGQRDSGCVKNITWCVLEISEELESDLLKAVSLEDGIIITTSDVIWGKDSRG